MLVGIIDYDLFLSLKQFNPNPEIMLISAYHKKRGDVVHLLLNGKEIQAYDKIYLRRNKKGKKIPQWMYSLPNIDIGGSYFVNKKVFTLPEEYYEVLPDITIYDKYFRYLGENKIKGVTKYFSSSFISLKKEETWTTPKRCTYIYDHDLGSKETFEKLQELYERKLFSKLTFCYPVHCATMEELVLWAKAEWVHNKTIIYYDNTISLKEINDLRKENPRVPIYAYLSKKNRFYSQKEIEYEVVEGVKKTLFCIINKIPLKFILPPTYRPSPEKAILTRVEEWNVTKLQSSFERFCEQRNMCNQLEDIYVHYPESKELFAVDPHKRKREGGFWHYGRP